MNWVADLTPTDLVKAEPAIEEANLALVVLTSDFLRIWLDLRKCLIINGGNKIL